MRSRLEPMKKVARMLRAPRAPVAELVLGPKARFAPVPLKDSTTKFE